MGKENIIDNISKIASTMKLSCGVGNNAAWLVCLEANDHLKRCSLYRRSTKGGYRIGSGFKKALKMYKAYERNLIYTSESRLFHVADMPAATRKIYGDITDRDYYDMWSSIGCRVYSDTKPYITSLWNKYRKILEAHGNKEPEAVAWAFTALACLKLACNIYDATLKSCAEETNISKKLLSKIFSQLSLREIAKVWESATDELAPEFVGKQLDEIEEKNLNFGLEQLLEAWTDPHSIFSATKTNIADFSEVFRTDGEMKKAIKGADEIEKIVEKELNQNK